jgi:hypothetical protein
MALTGKRPPLISSIQDLTIIEAFDPGAAEAKYVTFYFLTPEDDFYFSQLFKPKKEISLAKFNATLEYVPDKDIYPEQRTDILLTTAPDGLDDGGAFIKRPCLIAYESLKGTDFIPKEVLAETLIMERLSRSPHPNIIRYLGCCVRGGLPTLARTGTQRHQPAQHHDQKGRYARADRLRLLPTGWGASAVAGLAGVVRGGHLHVTDQA